MDKSYLYSRHPIDYGKIKMTFGKYKGERVTWVLFLDPIYFGWCKKNVPYFTFSIRDYEIYIDFASLWQNHLQATGYANKNEIKRIINDRAEKGRYDKYPNNQYLTKDTIKDYLQKRKNFK